MPELPEVETVRRGIEAKVVGRAITSVEVGRERSVRRVGREAVIHGLTGATMTQVWRRGKYLVCDLDNGEQMMIHLRMSGRVLIAPAGTMRPPHTHVVCTLAPASDATDSHVDEMWFVDPRTFGEVVVYDARHREQVVPELSRLGPDPLADHFDAEVLAHRLARRHAPIKSVLLNQQVVAGIGNIYADESLHRARLRWNRPASSLSRQAVRRLSDAIVDVLSAAVAAGGSTLDDTQYVDVDGVTGWFQLEHRVYGRIGQQCLTCGKSRIAKATVAGRTTAYCPRCQK